jgi:predicted membrane protein
MVGFGSDRPRHNAMAYASRRHWLNFGQAVLVVAGAAAGGILLRVIAGIGFNSVSWHNVFAFAAAAIVFAVIFIEAHGAAAGPRRQLGRIVGGFGSVYFGMQVVRLLAGD